MATTVAQLLAEIKVVGAEQSAAKLTQFGGQINATGGMLGGVLVAGAAAAGAALVGLGVASVNTAADFQSTMDQTRALAGMTDEEANKATEAIKKMAVEIGQTPQQLAQGLYYVKSAGYDTSASLNILALSAKAAAVGHVDTEVTANALTSALKASGASAADAGKFMDMMTKSVSLGKTEWADYAPVIGKVSLNAKQAGVSFAEATSALSVLTNTFPSTRAAADALNALLQTTSRFDLLEQRARKLGLTFDANAFKSMDFAGRLHYLQEITGGNSEELAKLLGRQNAVSAMTAILSGNTKDYSDALGQVKNSAGAAQEAFQKVSAGFNQAKDRLGAAVQVLLLSIGEKLLPILTKVVDGVRPIVEWFTKWFSSADRFKGIGDLFDQVWKKIQEFANNLAQTPGFKEFANLIRDIFNEMAKFPPPGLKMFGDQMGQIFSSGNLKSGAEGLGTALGWIAQAAKDIGNAWQQAQPFLRQIGDYIAQTFKPVWDQLVDTFNNQLKPAWKEFMDALQPALPALKFIAEVVGGVLLFAFLGFVRGVADTMRGAIIIIGILTTAVGKSVDAWLSGLTTIWNAIQWLINLWNSLPGVWSAIWTAISGAAQAAWNWIQTTAATVWNGIVSFFSGIWNGIVNTVQGAINNVIGAFNWLYQHNYYFQALVDAIRTAISAGLAWLQSAWNAVVSWLTGLWNGLVGAASSAWNAVSGAVSSAANAVIGWLRGVWSGAISWLSGVWNGLVGIAQSVWNNVTGAFRAAWGGISGALSSIGNNISGWFNGLANSAYNWGRNLVQGFINGLNSLAQSVANTASNIANQVGKFLGFHSPAEEGPGRDADKWAPNLIKMFVAGLASGIPAVNAAFGALAGPALGASVSHSIGGASVSTLPGGAFAPSARSAGTGTQTIQILLDGRLIGEVAGRYQAKQVIVQTGWRGIL